MRPSSLTALVLAFLAFAVVHSASALQPQHAKKGNVLDTPQGAGGAGSRLELRAPVHSPPPDICPTCTAVVSLVVEAIQKDPAFYEAEGVRICTELGPVADVEKCKTYVVLTVKLISIKALTPVKICELGHLCQPAVMRRLIAAGAQPTPSGSACEGCKALLLEIKQALADPSTAELLEAALAAACATSGAYQEVCTLAVKELTGDGQLAQLLVKLSAAIEPIHGCAALHLCPGPALLGPGGMRQIEPMPAA